MRDELLELLRLPLDKQIELLINKEREGRKNNE